MAHDVTQEDELLSTLVEWVDNAEEASDDARKAAERDRDYYDNKQWTDEEIAILEKRGQPVITVNRIKRKIDFLEGIERQQRTDPKAYPRTPDSEDAATAATDGIRFVCEKERYDVIRSGVWKDLMIPGIGGVLVGAKQEADKVEIALKELPWDRVGYDPHSSKPDFSDAKYIYYITWMDFDDALAMWPDKEDVLESTLVDTNIDDTYDDKPKYLLWADAKRKRVKIVEMYFNKDGWKFCQFTKGGKLAGGPSPYLDENNEPENPIKLTSGYVDRDNNRYGVVREMIGPQDEINKRRSKALHMVSVRQVIAEEGAVQDEERAKSELAKPDGWITKNPGINMEVLDGAQLAVPQFNLLQEAKNEIDLMGPNASMGGKGEKGQSGRAIIAQQQGGFVELGPMLDRLRQFNYAVYRAIWNRIRQFWTEERWIRVTDDKRNLRFVGFNKPLTLGEQIAKQSGADQKTIDQNMQRIQAHPQYGQIVGMDNNPAEIDVDILIEDAPDSVTIQMEQFEQLAKLASSGVPIPPDVLIEAAPSLRNKGQILERMKPSPEQQQAAQQQQAIQSQVIELDLSEKQAKARKTNAEAQKTELETVLAAADPDPQIIL